MIVIAKVKSVTKHQASEADSNPFGLEEEETYFLCQIEKLEHIVGFEGDEFSFTDYACKWDPLKRKQTTFNTQLFTNSSDLFVILIFKYNM